MDSINHLPVVAVSLHLGNGPECPKYGSAIPSSVTDIADLNLSVFPAKDSGSGCIP